MSDWLKLNTVSTSIIYCDCSQSDMPVVCVNKAFETQTGYQAADIIGKNCRILQGADTDPTSIEEIRKIIKSGHNGQVTLLNYRKDGTAFWNEIELSPVRDASGLITHYVSLQRDVTTQVKLQHERSKTIRELQHRLRNMFSVMISVVRNSSPDGINSTTFKNMLFDRLDALAKANAFAHNYFFQEDNLGFDVIHFYHSQILTTVDPEQVSYKDNDINISADEINNVGLVFNELIHISNASGALSHTKGNVAIEWQQKDGLSIMTWSENCQGTQQLTHYDNQFAIKLIQTINTMNQFDSGVFRQNNSQIHCAIGFRNKV